MVIIGMTAIAVGEKIWKGIHLRVLKKKVEKGGPLFINNTTRVMVVVVEVISGGLFTSPSVVYEVGEKRIQISLESFIESFQQCKVIVRD
jgi:hypothetical protein